jgi:hypothetical protein
MNKVQAKLVYALSTLSLIYLAACSPANPKKEEPLKPLAESVLSSSIEKIDIIPKVDMLFLVDYSTSMDKHQVNLAKNIDSFVEAFKDNKLIDFHFGVTTIYDSYHCGKLVKGNVAKCFDLGALQKLKNPDYNGAPGKDALDNPPGSEIEGVRFVTRSTPNYLNVIKKTLHVGEALGPAYEEVFTPIMPALTAMQGPSEPNFGFYRDDAYLLVVFITDMDAKPPGPSAVSLLQSLTDLKHGNSDRILTAGIISPVGESCPKDPGAPDGPKEIEKFLTISHGYKLSLCSKNSGKELGKLGQDLSNRIAPQVIKLDGAKDKNQPIEVFYNGKAVAPASPSDFTKGWIFNPENSTLTLGVNTVYPLSSNGAGSEGEGKLSIRYTKYTSLAIERKAAR